jgi:hypothetical protein
MNSFDVRFIRKTIRPFRTYGRYRGSGTIEFFDDNLRINGRHVMALWIRSIVGLSLFATLMLTLTIASAVILSLYPASYLDNVLSNPLLLILNILLSPFAIILISSLVPFVIMEHIWLERESLLIPYVDLYRYVLKQKSKQIGIEFGGSRNTSPVVLTSIQCEQIHALLKEKAPKSDVDIVVAPPEPVERRVVTFIFVYLVSAALSFIALFILLTLFFLNENQTLTVDQMNIITLLLAIILLVIIPLLIALKVDRNNNK